MFEKALTWMPSSIEVKMFSYLTLSRFLSEKPNLDTTGKKTLPAASSKMLYIPMPCI
jgi:hypothetical protein